MSGPRPKTLREQQRLMELEFTRPEELLAIAHQKGLVVVLDKRPPVRDNFGTWVRTTYPDVVAKEPDRYESFDDPALLKHALIQRALYAAVSPQGYIRFRKMPAGITIDWARGKVVVA